VAKPDTPSQGQANSQAGDRQPQDRMIAPVCREPASDHRTQHTSDRRGRIQHPHPCPFTDGRQVRREGDTANAEQ
jgi:hypothetical protein